MKIDDRLLTTKEAASALGLSYSWMRHLVADKKISVCKFGKAVRISRKDLDTFVSEHRLYSKSEIDRIATSHVAGHTNPVL